MSFMASELLTGREVVSIYNQVLNCKDPSVFAEPLKTNFFSAANSNLRPHSISMEDAFLGDSGKGANILKINEYLLKRFGAPIYSFRWNGGANAGHEAYKNGQKFVAHQLPMAVFSEGATAFITRGVVVHPGDLMSEIKMREKELGGRLPGKLYIDQNALLNLDTHRAREVFLKQKSGAGAGSTCKGISQSYAALSEHIDVTVRQLMDEKWEETLRAHYRLYDAMHKDFNMAGTHVSKLSRTPKDSHPVGTESEFIDRLQAQRKFLEKYIHPDVYSHMKEIWQNPNNPVTFEGAQGAGLDPWHGVNPDTTASRPNSRNINDSTYNIMLPEEIALRFAVMKTLYMSSVGARILPNEGDKEFEDHIRNSQDEYGRTTQRPRDIYPPMATFGNYLKRGAGYEFLFPTHIDAAQPGEKIKVITHFKNPSGLEVAYKPYQYHLDSLKAHIIEFESWNGAEVSKAKSPKDLDPNLLRLLGFWSQVLAPVALAAYGPDTDEYLSWIKEW